MSLVPVRDQLLELNIRFFKIFSFSTYQVCTVKAHELASHIPVSSLPEHLGGTSQYSHVAWIQSCVNMQTNTVQGDTQEHDAHDCVGSLLRSYSLDNSNTSIGATLPHTHLNAHLDTERAVANCYGDNNANPHNHFDGVECRTRGLGQYQHGFSSGADKSQGNHQHWNGSAVNAANTSVCGPNININGRSCPVPLQSDTPLDTSLSQEDVGDAAGGDATKEGDEEGVPPLPQKSLPRPTNQPSSQSPPLSSSWGPDDENRYSEVSIHMPDQGGMTVHELVEYVKRKKKRGIYQEYEDIRKEPPAGTFDYSK